eukprot:11871-Eustigmatos_ZCMA.PRE.1
MPRTCETGRRSAIASGTREARWSHCLYSVSQMVLVFVMRLSPLYAFRGDTISTCVTSVASGMSH